MFYNYSANLSSDFANYMDNLYYKESRKYYSVLMNILEDRSILFSKSDSIVTDNHLRQIKLFIEKYINKFHLSKMSNETKKYFDIALYDFKIGLCSNNLVYLSDLYSFASYMKDFYKKIPYFEVADLLCLLNNNQDNLIDKDFYLKFLNSDCMDFKKCNGGHSMEICNYTTPKVMIKL